MIRKTIIAAMLLAAGTLPALAHLDPQEHGSLAAGFSHPFLGADHISAMVAVGLWAVLIGARKARESALWQVPAAFVGVMALGFAAAIAGLELPFVEPAILASVVMLGLAIALAAPVPAWAGMAVAGFFAFFHGHAHGGEIGSASVIGYGLGFALATALLHGTGMAAGAGLGRFLEAAAARATTRIAGALTALFGVWLALGA